MVMRVHLMKVNVWVDAVLKDQEKMVDSECVFKFVLAEGKARTRVILSLCCLSRNLKIRGWTQELKLN